MKKMSLADNREAANLIDEICVDDGGYLDADKIHRLKELIPMQKDHHGVMTYKKESSSGNNSIMGFSPGLGNVSMEDDSVEPELVVKNGLPEWNAGMYVVQHMPGFLLIRASANKFAMGDDGGICQLCYSQDNALEVQSFLNFVERRPKPLLSLVRWKEWKTLDPETAGYKIQKDRTETDKEAAKFKLLSVVGAGFALFGAVSSLGIVFNPYCQVEGVTPVERDVPVCTPEKSADWKRNLGSALEVIALSAVLAEVARRRSKSVRASFEKRCGQRIQDYNDSNKNVSFAPKK